MSPRHSIIRGDHVEYGFWLLFDEEGGMRMTRAQPAVGRDERAMFCSATLPLSLFSTPQLRATISISDPGSASFSIDIEAASSALKAVVGCDVDLRIQPAETP